MHFAQPYWLTLLVLVPLLGLWEWRRARRRSGGLRFSSVAAAKTASPSLWVRLRGLPPLLRMGALTLGILALARPQQLNVAEKRYAEGVDIMLVLDTSTSMRAQDFQPNRFEAARDVASDFIRSRLSDRVGIVIFAGKAYTQAPLTLDYDFLQAMLSEVQIGETEDGTAIGTALATAVNRLKDTQAKSKVAILLTDGQNNRGEIDPLTAADVARAMGVRVYTIGVGTYGEAPYVVDHPFLGKQVQMVPVEIDEDMLKEVASRTGGQYFRATDKKALRHIYQEIGELEKTKV
ncbi:MAG TPA: VWA domain-containing protein, partial [Rhodothermales bacterium]|nr:VWA domain-containing protein [Rhodothermales bacterium]